jgi:hypothetical protein
MEKYTNKNKFFNDIIDELLKKQFKKDNDNKNNNLCDIDYIYRFDYSKCKIVSQLHTTDILGNKWYQYKNYIKWCINNKLDNKLRFIPTTYKISKTNINHKFLKKLFKQNNKWIIKPINGSFRAGIHVIKSYNDLIKWIYQYINTHWILQYYIDNPLIVEHKKFHFRIYVLLIKTKSYTQVLIYNKGYMFLSQKEYDSTSLDDESNLSGGDSIDVMRLYPNIFIKKFGYKNYKIILQQINEIVKYTMLATIDKLVCINKNKQNYKCYKLFGYDILIDKNFKCHLGEINARTINVKFPIKNMYENLLKIILLEGPLKNNYLFKNNLDWYSIILK